MWWVQNVMQIGQWFMAYYDFVKKKTCSNKFFDQGAMDPLWLWRVIYCPPSSYSNNICKGRRQKKLDFSQKRFPL